MPLTVGVLLGALVLFAGLGGQAGAAGPPQIYVFNMDSRDVTVIEPGTHRVVATGPLGASVKWLSNEQDYFDGTRIWTYEDVADRADVLVIDPAEMKVVRRIPVGRGPAHSVMLTPDRKYALVNAAGDNWIAVIDTGTFRIVHRIGTGQFPCDLDMTPDGRTAYFPERDQDTVSALDLATWRITRTVQFPKGSKPHMLRVSPDGQQVWVQTGKGNTNDVLDSRTFRSLSSRPVGKAPYTNVFTPDGRYSFVSHGGEDFVTVFDATSLTEVKRIEVGPGGANMGFSPDGRFAYIAVNKRNDVAVIDVTRLEVVARVPAGRGPFGLIVFPPRAGRPGG